MKKMENFFLSIAVLGTSLLSDILSEKGMRNVVKEVIRARERF